MTVYVSRGAMMVVYFTLVMDLIGFGIILPQLPVLAERSGASDFEAASLSAVFSFAQMIGSMFWGYFSDYVGRRPVIIACICGQIVSFALMSLSGRLLFLFLTRAAQGMFSGNLSSVLAYVVDVTDAESRPAYMGYAGAAMGLGVIIGPVLGGLLSVWGFGASCLGSAAFAGLNLISAIFFLSNPPAREKDASYSVVGSEQTPGREILHLTLICLAQFFSQLNFASFEATFALLYYKELDASPGEIGEAFAIAGIVMTIVQAVFVGISARKLGLPFTIFLGCLIRACIHAYMPYSPTDAIMITSVATYAIGGALISPSLQSMASLHSSPQTAGKVMGLFQLSASLARGIGPLGSGAVFQRDRHLCYFVSASLLVVTAGLIVPFLFFKKEQDVMTSTFPDNDKNAALLDADNMADSSDQS